MKKIYDCFTFFNELELLEIRLTENFDDVDYFVIAEANKTHQGHPKPFYIEENWDRFLKFHDKIRYIKVDDMPVDSNTWVLENFQRNALARGFEDASPNDVIVVSDLDEILRSSTYNLIRNDQQHTLWVCRQPIFWSKLNYIQIEPSESGYNVNSMAIVKHRFTTAQDLRNMTTWAFWQLPMQYSDESTLTIQHAGWHFSYLGDDKQAKLKIESFAHAEARPLIPTLNVNARISEGKNTIAPDDPGKYAPVIIDDYFPNTVLNNQEKYAHLIVLAATLRIRDFLPKFTS